MEARTIFHGPFFSRFGAHTGQRLEISQAKGGFPHYPLLMSSFKRLLLVLALVPGIAQAAAKPPPVLKITLQQTQCYGTCPAFTATFSANGKVTYLGDDRYNLKGMKPGLTQGRLSKAAFKALADLVKSSQFAALKPSYRDSRTDGSTSYITVNWPKKVKKVEVYVTRVPGFQLLQNAILDALANKVVWKKKP